MPTTPAPYAPAAFAPPPQVSLDGRRNLIGLSRDARALEMEAMGAECNRRQGTLQALLMARRAAVKPSRE